MHVYIAGIGGAGLGPLALIAQDAGYEVTASDRSISPNTTAASDRGINVIIGQTTEAISEIHKQKPIDLFVYTGAITTGHPEFEFAQNNNIKMTMMYGLLNMVVEDHKLQLIAAAGTHGKTTTSGMLTWVFQQLKIPASHLVGSTLQFAPSGEFNKHGKYMIVEADEYHKKFLDLHPKVTIITSIDYDHPDTYPTPNLYYEAFNTFIQQSSESWGWHADLLKLNALNTVSLDESDQRITLPGEHMRRNATLVLTSLMHLIGHENEENIIRALNDFPGTNRRFERIALNIYSDYGHHPTEIKATLQMATEINPDVVIVYQPHQNLRQQQLVNDGGYGDTFEKAHTVYWLPTYLSRELEGAPILAPEDLIATTTNPSIMTPSFLNENLRDELAQHARANRIVLLMTAGDADEWLRKQFS